MKLMILMMALTILLTGCQNNTTASCCDVKNPFIGSIRHVVLFSFKETSSKEDIQKVEKAFAALKGKIPLIRDYEWGTNNSPEGLSQGFTHCFFVTFDTPEDRDAYLPHPEHKNFVTILKPHLDKVLVVDYKAQAE